MPRIKFLGASGTVTGSKYLVSHEGLKILVDAGMFQGERRWRDENWTQPPVELSKIDAVLLTHAHIDHTGILPRYVGMGLKCPVYCTKATRELSALTLPDSGRLQEEEAEYRLKTKKSKHYPPQPLYTEENARQALALFNDVPWGKPVTVLPGVQAQWSHMGHILGAASIRLSIGGRTINFSGDIGRYDVPILKDPEAVQFADLLLIESTYGNIDHPTQKPDEELAKIINETASRGGTVVIPSFAVGRTQLLLFYIGQLKKANKIPDIPVVIDSPMATDATAVYAANPEDYDDEFLGIICRGTKPFSFSNLRFVKSVEESKALNSMKQPGIIISASGMVTGGRILHHLLNKITSPLNTILFVGYQPQGGRGAWILSGAKTLRLFGEEVPIRAEIANMSGMSAHGGKSELLRWCKESKGTPARVAVVHGERDVSAIFRKTLETELKWNAFCPEYLQEIEI